jgi:hypothetical protein
MNIPTRTNLFSMADAVNRYQSFGSKDCEYRKPDSVIRHYQRTKQNGTGRSGAAFGDMRFRNSSTGAAFEVQMPENVRQ